MKSVLALLLTLSLALALDAAPARQSIVLRDGWSIRRLAPGTADITALTRAARSPDTNWLAVPNMPSQVQEVLLERGLIPDPTVSRNCARTTWVFELDWVYATTFVTPAASNSDAAFLRCDGLDTLATVFLNGMEVGQAANMFRRHRFDMSRALAPPGQTNVLLIQFHSPARFLEDLRRRPGLGDRPGPLFKHLRKCGQDFSSYMGMKPHYMKIGLFRDVVLDLPGQAWFEDVAVRTELNADFSAATVMVDAEIAGSADELRWRLLGPEGQRVAAGKSAPGLLKIEVPQPALWWPHTHGTPVLYTLQLELQAGGVTQDRRGVPFGIRRIEPVLRDPVTGEPRFAFKVNGQQIYLRGACWAPLRLTTHVWNEARANQLLDLAVHSHLNTLRVWGEGVIPADHFFEECDRRGLVLWQEFMTGHGMYFPLDDPAFRDNLTAEIVDEIKRLRNHPSIFLWCGGNEHYLGFPSENPNDPNAPVGRELLQGIMPALVQEHDPTRFYHPSSPWGGASVNWPNGNFPLEGDWHDYSTLRFQPFASVPLFGSELCQISPPSLSSMKRYLTDAEIWPPGFEFRVDEPGEIAWPPEWEYHTTGQAWEKMGRIEDFCEPRSPSELVRVLGTAHGEYLQGRVERMRRGIPDGAPAGPRRAWGNTLWRLNDSWPMMYMSIVDYYNEPKIAYYYYRRAHTPVLLSWEKTADHNHVWVVNDSAQTVSGEVRVQRLDFRGQVRSRKTRTVTVPPGESLRVMDTDSLGEIVRRSELLLAEFQDQTAVCLLAPERYLNLTKAKPKLTVRRAAQGLQISTDNFAKQVTLEMPGVTGAVFEDNYFNLPPGQTRIIPILKAAGGTRVRVRAVLAEAVDIDL